MGCTCRAPARCPVCNTPVRVPLSNLDRVAAMAGRGRPRRDAPPLRAGGLGYLIEGTSSCPRCGHSVHVEHTRPCFSKALVSVGVAQTDLASILARITFPEG